MIAQSSPVNSPDSYLVCYSAGGCPTFAFLSSLSCFGSVFCFGCVSCFGCADNSNVTFSKSAIRQKHRGWGESNRPIVDQSNLHHGLEFTILDPVRRIPLLHFTVEVFVQLLGIFCTHGSVEVRFAALFGRGEERELRHCDASQTPNP